MSDVDDRSDQGSTDEPAGTPGTTGPGERRLDRPPSDRYRRATPDGPPASSGAGERSPTPVRGLACGALAATVGVVVIVGLGGALAISAGLLVVAAVIGYSIALAVRLGGGATLRGSRRVWIVVGLAVGAVALGQVGLWLYARGEGGVLALPDYLAQVYGVLVPLQLVVAAIAGWWTAR